MKQKESTFFGKAIPIFTLLPLFVTFCTPQTVQAVGIKKSIIIGRCLGAIVILLGILFYFIM